MYVCFFFYNSTVYLKFRKINKLHICNIYFLQFAYLCSLLCSFKIPQVKNMYHQFNIFVQFKSVSEYLQHPYENDLVETLALTILQLVVQHLHHKFFLHIYLYNTLNDIVFECLEDSSLKIMDLLSGSTFTTRVATSKLELDSIATLPL